LCGLRSWCHCCCDYCYFGIYVDIIVVGCVVVGCFIVVNADVGVVGINTTNDVDVVVGGVVV